MHNPRSVKRERLVLSYHLHGLPKGLFILRRGDPGRRVIIHTEPPGARKLLILSFIKSFELFFENLQSWLGRQGDPGWRLVLLGPCFFCLFSRLLRSREEPSLPCVYDRVLEDCS